MTNINPLSVGVVVGRFQVPRLHAGHLSLIDFVASQNAELMIVLGVSDFPSHKNELTFAMRRDMLRKTYPKALILPLEDRRDDAEWSRELDALIGSYFHSRPVTLYGSRDSFIASYCGLYPTFELPNRRGISGTKMRERIVKRPLNSAAFRQGIIYAYEQKPGLSTAVVDIAVVRPHTGEVLLGAKEKDGNKLRFLGGLVDPVLDQTFEAAAKREAYEETSGIEIDDVRYLASCRIRDWRLRASKDGVMTAFHVATYIFGAPRPADDIVRLEWIPYERIKDVLIEDHQPLADIFINYVGSAKAAAA